MTTFYMVLPIKDTQLNTKLLVKSEITSIAKVLEIKKYIYIVSYCFFLSVALKIKPAANLLVRGLVLLKRNDNWPMLLKLSNS